MSVSLVPVAAAIAAPGLLTAFHLTALTLASLAYEEPQPATEPAPVRFLVLIPARDEAAVLGATLTAIGAALRPGDLVLVVADHCADSTAEIARRHGATVLERGVERTPGRAAARQDGLAAASGLDWDAVVMIDADSVVEPGFLDACEHGLRSGVDALQVRGEAMAGPGVVAQASVVAFALQGISVPRGRDRLGCSVRLKGTGMVLRRHLVERFRFRGPGASEDMWLGLDLCCAGIRARHLDSARLRSESARTLRVASGQRLRWEVGRILAAREFLVPLLRRHDRAALEMALHLVSPPLAVAMLSLLAGTAVALAGHEQVTALVLAAALGLLALDVTVALVEARAGWRTWLSLLAAPWYVVWKGWIQIRAVVRALGAPGAEFPPTAREP